MVLGTLQCSFLTFVDMLMGVGGWVSLSSLYERCVRVLYKLRLFTMLYSERVMISILEDLLWYATPYQCPNITNPLHTTFGSKTLKLDKSKLMFYSPNSTTVFYLLKILLCGQICAFWVDIWNFQLFFLNYELS